MTATPLADYPLAMPETTLSELARLLEGQLDGGDGGAIIRGVAPIEAAGADQVTFLTNARYERHAETTQAAALIVARQYAGPGRSLIRCQDPYYAFRQAMVFFAGFRQPEFDGIDARANIHPTAKLAAGVRVGAFATIGPGCVIGDNTVLYPGAYVGPRCRIGGGCVIYPNVTLYDGTILHDRVTIHAGSSIGHDGFGYATHKGGDGVARHEKIPQSGWVELESDVEIGAGCAIDRATLGATIIGAGTKFYNLVAIGHGTQMGRHCLMVAQAGIAGSVMVGNYCVFGGQAGVVGHIRLADGVRVAAQSGVTNDVPAGTEVAGSPAIPLADARRAMIGATQLPQLRAAVRKMEREVNALKTKLGIRDAGEADRGGAD